MNSSSPLFVQSQLAWPLAREPPKRKSVKLIDNNELLIKMENGEHKSRITRTDFVASIDKGDGETISQSNS
jgi:hypothetical protein